MTNRTLDQEGETLSVRTETRMDLNLAGQPVVRTIRRISDHADRAPDGGNPGKTAVTGNPVQQPDVVPIVVPRCASVSVKGPDLGFKAKARGVPNSGVAMRGSGLDSKAAPNPKAGGVQTDQVARGARDKTIMAPAVGDMADLVGNRVTARTSTSGIPEGTTLIQKRKTGTRTLKPLANDRRLADWAAMDANEPAPLRQVGRK